MTQPVITSNAQMIDDTYSSVDLDNSDDEDEIYRPNKSRVNFDDDDEAVDTMEHIVANPPRSGGLSRLIRLDQVRLAQV
jgi:hypothetical protein